MKIETIALPIVRLALAEDLGAGDVTTRALVSETARAKGVIEAKAEGVLCGLEVARLAFHELDPDLVFRTRLRDGARLQPGEAVGQMEGRARALLSAERVALNLLQHLSGIATLTARFVAALDGTGVKVRDTRKTLPGLRVLEKYAVLVGGGQNHRFGLFDMFLIKDNHLPAVGSITGAVRAARRADSELPIQVEVRNAEEAREAVRAGVDQILLDNMNPGEIAVAVEAIDETCESLTPAHKRPWVEVSGGVQLANVRERALKGVDSVSIGALTHSAPALDLSLTIESIEDFA